MGNFVAEFFSDKTALGRSFLFHVEKHFDSGPEEEPDAEAQHDATGRGDGFPIHQSHPGEDECKQDEKAADAARDERLIHEGIVLVLAARGKAEGGLSKHALAAEVAANNKGLRKYPKNCKDGSVFGMFSSRPQKPLKQWTDRELRNSIIAVYIFLLFFVVATGLFAWQVAAFSFPVFFCSLGAVVLLVSSRPLILESRHRRRDTHSKAA